MQRLKYPLALGAALGSSWMLTCAAYAQGSSTDATAGPDLEEVIVTARMRSESLQSVPIAVSSFGEKIIQDAGIERPADFIALTPNVSIAESQQPGVNFISIRGVSQIRNGESPVAVVVDGVLQTVSNQFNTDLFDLQQIEVLKGPQGALYGRNAIGGAIVITTREPSNDFEGQLSLGSGNGGQAKAQLGVSGPIVEDKVFASISGSFKNRDGYLKNVFLNNKVDPYNSRSVRGRVILLPTETFKVDSRASYDRTHAGALYFTRNNVDASGFYVYYPSVRSDASKPGSPDDYGPPLNSNINGDALREIFSTALKLDLETRLGTLTSTSSYDTVAEWDTGDASPYTSAVAGTQSSDFDYHVKSTELRLTSPSEQQFRYILGAYYLDLHRVAQRNNGRDMGSGVVLLGYNDASTVNPSTNNTADDNNQRSYAFFGQLNYDLTDSLELSGALRHDRDERDTLNISHPKDANSFATYTPVGTPGKYRKATFEAWQPKATLRYKIDPGSSVYISYSQGFRSGGFNQDGVREVALRANPNSTVTDDYQKEITTTYEAGWKAQFLTRTLTVNSSIFYTKFEDAQYFVFIPEASAQIITNIDAADMKGFEVEVNYRPISGWEIFGNIGYTDAVIKAYAAQPASVDKTMPYVPKLGFNLGTQYAYPLTDTLELIARVDMHRKGSQYWETSNTAGERSAFNLYDVRLSLGDTINKWRVSAWARNASNKKYNAEFVAGGFTYPAEPRTFGLDLDYRF